MIRGLSCNIFLDFQLFLKLNQKTNKQKFIGVISDKCVSHLVLSCISHFLHFLKLLIC